MNPNTLNPQNAVAVTPSDLAALAGGPCKEFYVGVAGNVTMVLAGDTNAVLFKGMAVGKHQYQVKQFKATGTAATDIVALY